MRRAFTALTALTLSVTTLVPTAGAASLDDGTAARDVPVPSRYAAVTASGRLTDGRRVDVEVSVEPGLQRIEAEYVSYDHRDDPTARDNWIRVSLGDRAADGSCHVQRFVVGNVNDTGSFAVLDRDGLRQPVAERHSLPRYGASGIDRGTVRLQMPADAVVPDGCARVQISRARGIGGPWAAPGATRALRTPELAFLEGSPFFAGNPSNDAFVARPGADNAVYLEVNHPYTLPPSIYPRMTVSLDGRLTGEVTLENWDRWTDSNRIRVPVTLDSPFDGSTEYLVGHTWEADPSPDSPVPVWVEHAVPPGWDDSLAGSRLWESRSRGRNVAPAAYVIDDTWMRIVEWGNRYDVRPCTATSDLRWMGCHRYHYDAATGRIQLDSARAPHRTEPTRWTFDSYTFALTHRLGRVAVGTRLAYTGFGPWRRCVGKQGSEGSRGCQHPEVRLRLRRDGRYRISYLDTVQAGSYRVVKGSRIRLDPDKAAPTRVLPVVTKRLRSGTGTRLAGLNVGTYSTFTE